MRPAVDLLFRLRRAILKHLRLRTRGVKAMLFDDSGRILLIRNSYGRSDLWVLPGGGIRPWESPEQAVRREVKEEVGCGIDGLAFVSRHASRAEGKRDMIHLFRGRAVGEPRADGLELEAAAFFPLDALPATLSDATRRRIEEHVGRRAADGGW
jgi:ADP-ribose pyrophosphatase YjhB (NUDIX family)